MILFVCLGNICRSPMAEFVMRDLISKEKLTLPVMSAGTGGYHDGEDMHPKTRAMLCSKQINPDGFVSKKLTQDMCRQAQLIIAMDESNKHDIGRMFPQMKEKIRLLTDFIPESGYTEVPDPWYTGNFDETYRLVSAACPKILAEIQHKS